MTPSAPRASARRPRAPFEPSGDGSATHDAVMPEPAVGPRLDVHRRRSVRDVLILLGVGVVAVTLLVVGSRIMQGLPLVTSTYDLVAEWPRAEGLLPGAPVRLRGIPVGTVHAVALTPDGQAVLATLRIDATSPPISAGTSAVLGGLAALRNVYVDLEPPARPARRAALGDGERLATVPATSALAEMSARAPALADSTQATLAAAAGAARETQALMLGLRGEAANALRSTSAAGDATAALAGGARTTLDAQSARLAVTLAGVDRLTAALTRTAARADSVAGTVDAAGTQAALGRTLDRSTAAAEQTRLAAAELTSLAADLRSPDGTLGRLAADPALYDRSLAVLARVDSLVAGFDRDPGRFLRQLRLVKIF